MGSQGTAPEPITREQARRVPLPGWNHACQRCGNFGALWWPSVLRPNGNKLRLCNDCVNAQSAARRELQEVERKRFREDGSVVVRDVG